MTRIIILAAGKGTRMNSELPKVLAPLKNRPMIKYIMDSVVASQVDPCPIVVVSPDNKEIISRELKEYNVDYAIQDKQLGTGHAVACAQATLEKDDRKIDNIIVLYGDQPFLRVESIIKFSELKQKALTIIPTLIPNFDGWYKNFWHLGRIIRGEDGKVVRIREFKDANDEEKAVREINIGFMCFNYDWLFKNISTLRNNNNKAEYYLTDMVNIAFEQGYEVGTIHIEPEEAIGINSMDELNTAENLVS